MKILFITSSSINGGAQKHIREMYKSLSALGHDMYLVAPEGWLTNELVSFKDKIIKMNCVAKSIKDLAGVIEGIKPDVTNTFVLSGGIFGTMAWKEKKYGKLFVTVNNPVVYPGISTVRRILYPSMYRWMSRYVSVFLVKADKVRDEVAEVIRNKKPVISIKNGIDFNIFDKDIEYPNIRIKFGITKKDIVITNVAALDIRKGQQYLVEAAIELRKKYPVHIFLVGEGNDEERLKEIVKEKMAQNYIHFLGRRSDINVVLANSDIFILPSLHEGLPNALMEAMAMGLPCVATDVGGIRQLIDDADKGIVIHSKSVDEIIYAAKAVIDNPEMATMIGKNANKEMIKKFNQQEVAAELLTIYERYGKQENKNEKLAKGDKRTMNVVESVKKVIEMPWLIKQVVLRVIGRNMDDEIYVKKLYKIRNGVELNLEKPVDFFEKNNWLKIHDRRDIYSMMVDKYAVKDYVGRKIGKEYIIPTYGKWDSFDEINFEDLPDQFVLKCNHDCGSTVICKDKKKFNYKAAKKLIEKHLHTDYYKKFREWPYKNVKRCIFAEEYKENIVDENYKFFCFNGRCEFLYVAPYREASVDYFDREWTHLDGMHNVFHSEGNNPPEKPDNFEKMRSLAEKLSQGFPFLRVDFYRDNQEIFFGEITLYQEGGMAPWIPEEWNKKMGKYIDLKLVNR